MEILYHPEFRKSLRKLPENIVEKFIKRQLIFKSKPFDPRLKTHKLHGELKDFWSFSVDDKYRAVFKFLRENRVVFLDIGTHEIYK